MKYLRRAWVVLSFMKDRDFDLSAEVFVLFVFGYNAWKHFRKTDSRKFLTKISQS